MLTATTENANVSRRVISTQERRRINLKVGSTTLASEGPKTTHSFPRGGTNLKRLIRSTEQVANNMVATTAKLTWLFIAKMIG
jgi:hypothetical protein